MNIFLTASNERYYKTRDLSIKCALKYGKFHKAIAYDIDADIDEDFKKKNIAIFSVKRGAGLWLWKPYCIFKALNEECDENDVLFYLDAAGFFFRSVKPIIDSMQNDIYAVALPYIEEEFTKKEAFDIMQLNQEKYTKTPQFQASFMAFRKNAITVEFVKEWLGYAQNERLISPEVDPALQVPRFSSHRMDQSIFSLLCKKYNVQSHQEPTQYNFFGNTYYKGQTYIWNKTKEYPVCILLHRSSDFTSLLAKIKFVKRFISYIIRQLIYKYEKKY